MEHLRGYNVLKIDSFNVHSVALVESKKQAHLERTKAMIDNETCSDVVFVLKDDNDQRVHAAKSILIGQSEYFRVMFRNDTRERRENMIEVRECSKGTLLLFLEYLYTGSVEILGGRPVDDHMMENVMDLYALSHRYQETSLCRSCIRTIESRINDDNAMRLLVKAHDLGLEAIQGICMEYVGSNFWTSFKREMLASLPPSLMSEMLDSVYLRANKRARRG